ncbi:hypothetical protein C2E20_2559 [Micractinium conductrix]|uniref:Voltage-gated hydrogen channel 1 n=1 Tax=Micractinium conductrix TaxID=554055 RepID=A0A2P6VIR5_9CHLO|nr:hypothetical protein C2E20_2559 [Micractinium conductrix]|eukprot:PSC73972.1 hypothetical protein C2E20_2559 [Micractinium conductrix]
MALCLPSFRLRTSSIALLQRRWGLPLPPPLRRRRATASTQRSGAEADGPLSTDDYGTEDELPPPAAEDSHAAPSDGVESAAIVAAAGAAPASFALASTDDEGRWHDVMHRALMDSLQPPRAGHPSWWGKRFQRMQRRAAEVLESREAHYLVIGLVLVDLAIVLTELVLSSFYPTPELAPHMVHVAEEALSCTSIGILAFFTTELAAKLVVFGFKYFTHSSWHMFDAVVVVTSFTLELSLRGIAQEVASLLIFFRLWRIMRIMHGVAEAMELNHSQELSHLHTHNLQLEAELSVSQQKLQELQQQVALLNVAAAAKGIDLHFVLTTAAATQQQLAATAQQQLLAAAAASASKGLELQTILAAAAAAQQQVAAAAQQQLLAAAAAAAAPAAHSHAGGGSVGAAHPLVHSDATAAAVTAALTPPPAPAAAQEGSITLLPAGNTTGRARDA